MVGSTRAYRPPPLRPVVIGLTCIGVACFFLFSGMFLDAHGWPYSLVGSSLPFKIHPGSYFIFAAFALVLVRENPVTFFYRLAGLLPAHVIYLAAVLGLIVYTLARFGTAGASFMIDLHLMPVFVAILLSRFPTKLMATLFVTTILVMTLNASLAIAEYLTHTRLTPYLVDGKPVQEVYFRSTALLGHPLQNALITAVTILALPAARDRKLLVVICGLVLGLSLIAFGGRSALAVVLGLEAVSVPIWTVRRLVRRDYSYQQFVGSVMAGIFLAGAAIITLTTAGQGTRVLSGLHWDESANTRVIGLRILDMVSPSEIIFGIGQQGILERSERLASYYGIIGLENSWLLLMLIFGVAGLLVFLTALIAWLREILAGAPATAYLAVLGYLMIASTNNTLAAKDSSLIQLVILLYGARAYAAMLGQPVQRGTVQRRAANRAGAARQPA
jgi:hypothetical protein